MPWFRFAEASRLLGVSDDTVRRWVRSGRLRADIDGAGLQVLDGAELAAFARAQATDIPDSSRVSRSARNRFVGIVTRMTVDGVMAQVEIQAGRHRVVSLMSAEAVGELELEVGARAVAVVKATNVVVETPAESG